MCAPGIRIALIYVMLCSPALAATLTHGPMLGHTTDTTARVWVRADGPCVLEVRATAGEKDNTIRSETLALEVEGNFCGSVKIESLSPETSYSYSVFLDGQEQRPDVVQRLRTFPPPGKPGIVRIGFGHSLRSPGEQTIWRTVGSQQPHLFILMGDNIYSDSTVPDVQRKMYLKFRSDSYFQAFAATTPIYAVWDDHDYGFNDSDRTQPGKERSLRTFNELWPNPPSQAVETPGIWTRFTVGPIEFFLLDVRYHRSPNKDPDGPEKTILGAEQRAWFIKTVSESQATFKLPVSGSSWNCGGKESWNHRFGSEYDAILEQLRSKDVSGMILLGGDQHRCKIGVRPGKTWDGYDLHEWMAGPLWNHDMAVRAFGLITVNTLVSPATAEVAFLGVDGNPIEGWEIPYTAPDAPRLNRDELARPTGETLTEADLQWKDDQK